MEMPEPLASGRPDLSLAIPVSLSRSSSIQNSPSFLNNKQQAYDPPDLDNVNTIPAAPVVEMHTSIFSSDGSLTNFELDTSHSGAPQLPAIMSRPLPNLSRGISRYNSRASQRPQMSQSKFKELASKSRNKDGSNGEDNNAEDEDTDLEDSDEEQSTNARKQKSEMAKLRQRQSATLNVHRQNMKRLTGSASTMSLNKLRTSTMLSTAVPLNDTYAEKDDEDDIPLAILKNRGFPKPSTQTLHQQPESKMMSTAVSLPSMLANARESESPGPVMRRKPYPGSPSMNSIFRMGDAPVIEGGLVGEIAKEEQAKKSRLAGHMAFDRERQRYWDASYAQEQSSRAAESELIEALKAQVSELAANQNLIMNELNSIYASPNPGFTSAASMMGSGSLRNFDQAPLSNQSAVVRDHESHRLTNLMMQDPSELDDDNQWEKALADREALVDKWRDVGLE